MTRWLAALSVLLLGGCGPDFTLECAGAEAVIDGQTFSCDGCFAAMGCERNGEVLECPSGVRGSCSSDPERRESCCDGECITCP